MWSIIIPAYNEAARIKKTLDEIMNYSKRRGLDAELIVVNDGSSDDTAEAAGEFDGVKLINFEVNRGKGSAVREGMKLAAGEIVLFTDADLSTPIEEAELLLEAIEKGNDVAVGSRMAKPRRIKKFQPPHRVMLGLSFGALVRIMFSLDVKDTQCGFKMFTAKAAKAIAERMTLNGYAFDVEMLVLAKTMNFKIAEIPVIWADKPGSKVKVFRDFPKVVGELVEIRRRL
jgi:dolichyl-phosphate beta-glucosyltransferase